MNTALRILLVIVSLSVLADPAYSREETQQKREGFVQPPKQSLTGAPNEPTPAIDEYIGSRSNSNQIPPAGPPLKDVCKIQFPDRPGDFSIDVLPYILDTLGAIDTALTVAGVEVAGALGVVPAVGAPILAQLGLFVALGLPYAQAANEILQKEIYSGFSYGAVTAADGRSLNYTAERFWKRIIMVSPMMAGYENQFLNAHNRAMVIGHKAVARCRFNKQQRKQFVRDLWSRMTITPDVEYGKDWRKWSDWDWTMYYVGLAAVFNRDHLK